MATETQNDTIARQRITQVFRFLEEYNRRRNPVVRMIEDQPWRLRLSDLPHHPTVQLGRPLPNSEDEPPTENGSVPATEYDFVLRVGRSQITHSPEPPTLVREWLRSGWNEPDKQAELFSSRNTIQDGETIIVSLEENSEISLQFLEWKKLRDEWAFNELPGRVSRKLYEEFDTIYRSMQREAERQELVLGDGMLSWQLSDGIVRHPILLQRLLLTFDSEKPEFTIRRSEHPVELYSALFRGMAEVDGTAIGNCRKDLEQSQYDLLEDNLTSGFLKEFIVQLSPRGEMVDTSALIPAKDYPQIAREPVIFLRSRALGYASALEAILTDLKSDKVLPPALLSVVGIAPTIQQQVSEPSNTLLDSGNEQILMTKPANQEQIEIAQRLDKHGSVLVQGPPGTGKTHTISNLIGHLLAQGKSILVTSHTTKALRVLRDQVVPELQPLCVSVLDGSEASRHQLDSSISTIVERLSSPDANKLGRKAEVLHDKRFKLLTNLQNYTDQLRRARFDEYRDIVIAGRSFTPLEAGRRINEWKSSSSWIPTPVAPDTPLPLTVRELISLYRTNVTLTPEDENDLGSNLPKIENLITPTEFIEFLDERRKLEQTDFKLRAELWKPVNIDPSEAKLASLLQRAIESVGLIKSGTEWQRAAIEAGREGGHLQQSWENLLAEIEAIRADAAKNYEIQMRHGPSLAQSFTLEEQDKLLREIVGHLESGKKLSPLFLLSHNAWKKLIAESRTGTKLPATLEQFQALQSKVRLELRRNELRGWWTRQMVPLGGIDITQSVTPEEDCLRYKPSITQALGWHHTNWLPIEQEFQQIGFNWSELLNTTPLKFSPHGELLCLADTVLNNLPPILQSRLNYLRALKLTSDLKTILNYLSKLTDKPSPIVSQMQDALCVNIE